MGVNKDHKLSWTGIISVSEKSVWFQISPCTREPSFTGVIELSRNKSWEEREREGGLIQADRADLLNQTVSRLFVKGIICYQ